MRRPRPTRRRLAAGVVLALMLGGPGAPPNAALSAPVATPGASAFAARSCVKPTQVVRIGFSATRYPSIRRHTDAAIAGGWPRVLRINRAGADARRDKALRRVATRPGFDRDEYPPAVGRGRGAHLERGIRPRGWRADVRLVPLGENRSHGAVLGIKLRRYCDGTRFRYVFY